MLPARPVGRAPAVEVVDLREELAAGRRGLLSAALAEALASLDTTAGEQAILVLNRRGTASVVMCRDCGHVQACPDCERPLVYHRAGTTLRCHHCGRATPLATRCPSCGSPRIRYLGGGTERVEREVRETFPALRVGRLDRDVVEHRGAAERIVDAFSDGRLDVLVGTSLVTKGLDIPSVTLVGVVSSDVALNLPDERAAERTYQLLVQAIGRAGRGDRPGRAILQTYQPDHPAITAAASGDRVAFYDAELALRRRFGSPPFGTLVKLTVGLVDPAAAEREAVAMAERLRERAASRSAAVTVVGPAPAYIARRADRWRWNVVLRGDDPVALLDGGLDAPWSVDVDPEIAPVSRDHRQMPRSTVRATIGTTRPRSNTMTDPLNPTNPGDPGDPAEPTPSTPDESYSWTSEGAAGGGAHGTEAGGDATGASGASSAAGTATAILEQLREAVDDLAERATPTVREFSARAAELAAVAADRAAPLARRAGEVTSEASATLATKSRHWAADLRSSIGTDDGSAGEGGPGAPKAAPTETTGSPAADGESPSGDGPAPA